MQKINLELDFGNVSLSKVKPKRKNFLQLKKKKKAINLENNLYIRKM